MKRTIITIALYVALTMLICTSAVAFGFDDIIGKVKGVSWSAAAMLLSGVIAVGGLAVRAKWLSAILIAVGAVFNAIGAAFGVSGIALQDGKVSGDELKDGRDAFRGVWSAFGAVIKVFAGK